MSAAESYTEEEVREAFAPYGARRHLRFKEGFETWQSLDGHYFTLLPRNGRYPADQIEKALELLSAVAERLAKQAKA